MAEEELDFLGLGELHTTSCLEAPISSRRVYMREILGRKLGHSLFMRELQTSFVDMGMGLVLLDTGESKTFVRREHLCDKIRC